MSRVWFQKPEGNYGSFDVFRKFERMMSAVVIPDDPTPLAESIPTHVVLDAVKSLSRSGVAIHAHVPCDPIYRTRTLCFSCTTIPVGSMKVLPQEDNWRADPRTRELLDKIERLQAELEFHNDRPEADA